MFPRAKSFIMAAAATGLGLLEAEDFGIELGRLFEIGDLEGDVDDAPVVESLGRAFPVETRYLGRDQRASVDEQMARAERLHPGVVGWLPRDGGTRDYAGEGCSGDGSRWRVFFEWTGRS